MKKHTRPRILASALAILIMTAMTLNGCQSGDPNAPGTNGTGENQQPAGPQFPNHSEEEFKAYLDREPTSVMAYAGPFYNGSFDGFDAASQTYSEQRRQKVDEILAVIDGGLTTLGNLDKKLREEKDIFQWYVLEIQKIDKSTQKYTDGLLHATNLNLLSQSLSDLMLLKKKIDAMEKSAEWGALQFQKYAGLIELTHLYGVETASLLSRMTALYYLLESDSNTAYQELNKQFVAKMDPVSDQVDEILNEAHHTVAVAGYGEKLLFTVDYYFTRDTIKTLDTQIAASKKLIEEYTGGNANLSEEMLTILKKQLADMENYRNGIVAYLDKIPAEELVGKEILALNTDSNTDTVTNSDQSPNGNFLVPVAYAQMDIPGWFQQKVTDTIKTVKSIKNLGFAAVRVTGQAIKDTYDKSGAHEVVKDGAQIINSGLEVVNSSVKVAMQSAVNIYYGDQTWDEFKKQVEAEKKAIHDRFVAGTLGKDTYDELIKGVDTFQERTGKFVTSMGELTGDISGIVTGQPKIGKFVKEVTVAVGNEAKGVLDGATDFTKNLAIVMHPETSKEDTRKAMLGIYTALKGIKDDEGKLIEVELPDLEGLTKDKAVEQLTKDISKAAGLDEEEEDEFLDQLKKTFKEQLEDKETGTKGDKEDGDKEDGDKEDGDKEDGDKEDGDKEGGDKDTTTGDTTGTGDKETTPGDTTETADTTGTTPETAGDSETTGNATTPSSPLDEIFTNPNLTDQEIQDIILGEITKDLPPLPPKNKPETDTTDENLDSDNDGLPDESDNCRDISNSDQTDTDNDGLGNDCDPDCSGDTESDSVCDEVDNCPADVNADQKDTDADGKGDVCDFDAPPLSELSGAWPGSITINDIFISDEMRAQATEEGCDLSEVESMKGQTKPMGLNIVPTSETGGYLLMTGEDTTDKQIPFTYADGVLKANLSEEGASLNFNMTFTDKTATGEMNMDYMNGGIKMTGGMDLNK